MTTRYLVLYAFARADETAAPEDDAPRLGLAVSRLINSWLFRGLFRLQALAAPFKVWSDGVVTPNAEEIPCLRRLNELDLDDRAGRLAIMNDPAWVASFRHG